MTKTTEQDRAIGRREAIGRVSVIVGGLTLIGGSSLLAACQKEQPRADTTAAGTTAFTADDVAFLDEVADTILPTTSTPGAKAAQTGAFMALMVTDVYSPADRQIFREGMKKLDAASTQANRSGFMQATPAQRLALLTTLDREQKTYMDARAAAASHTTVDLGKKAPPESKEGDKFTGDQRAENAVGGPANPAAAITADSPPHYFRMMKELALLGYFTSEIGYTKTMRYQETPGRYDPCVPYAKGETSWAPHA